MRLFFSKNKRLISNNEFRAVLSRRLKVSDNLLTLYIAENDCGHPRLGISIGKSLGNAVTRNRLKRLLREAFRLSQYEIPQGCDYLIMMSVQLSKKSDKMLTDKTQYRHLTLKEVLNSFVTLTAKVSEKL